MALRLGFHLDEQGRDPMLVPVDVAVSTILTRLGVAELVLLVVVASSIGQNRVNLRSGFCAEESIINLLESGALHVVLLLAPVGHILAELIRRKCLAKRVAEAVDIACVTDPGILTALLRRGMFGNLLEINRNAIIEVALLL